MYATVSEFPGPLKMGRLIVSNSLLGLVLVGLSPLDAIAASATIPTEFQGTWITTKEGNLEGRAGGEVLRSDQKSDLCSALSRDAFAPHNFEGVLVLRGTTIATWEGQCKVFGGFQSSKGTYRTRWSCNGEHGPNQGTVIFELRRTTANVAMIATTTFSKGGKFTNTYDERCD